MKSTNINEKIVLIENRLRDFEDRSRSNTRSKKSGSKSKSRSESPLGLSEDQQIRDSSVDDENPPIICDYRNTRRVVLNVGGVRHEVLWKTLEKLPHSRLGKIRYARRIEEVLELCDDFNLKDNEIFFDRHASSFSSILNYYRTGKLHLIEEICILSFHDDLLYWGIDECFFESCCHLKYHQRKDNVLEEIRKEEEATKEKIDFEVFNSCCPTFQQKIWNLMEKPQTSRSARVNMASFI